MVKRDAAAHCEGRGVRLLHTLSVSSHLGDLRCADLSCPSSIRTEEPLCVMSRATTQGHLPCGAVVTEQRGIAALWAVLFI